MFACGIALGVFVIGLVLSLTVLFRCEKIVVEGVTRYQEADIISASSLGYGKNIFLANKTAAADKIEAMYPYIEEAQIRLSIPNTLKISVTEATPEYYIQDGTRYYIISKNSKLLEQVIERDQNIPTIIGCKLKDPKVGDIVNVENNKVITVLNQVAESMTSNAVTGIKEINLSDMANIELNYEDRITIVIGMPEDINYKIRTAMTIIYTKLSETDSGRLNCSNLIEGRTDGKSNQSSFRPNNLIVEDITEPPTEFPTVSVEEFENFEETEEAEVEIIEETEAEEAETEEESDVVSDTESEADDTE
jgi:cell division protein FtsQ